jgi:DNA-binding PadR family transcriptional regulator
MVLGVTVSYVLLGLLEEANRHGDDLKQSYDRRFGAFRPLRFGQVYRTLAEL